MMEEQLKTFRTLEGKPYRLVKLPMPRPILFEGERLPATYANFLVINGAVLCPTYDQPDLDAEALRLIGEAFPDREIVGIDCRSIIKQHGSLHCCTMQFPYIKHSWTSQAAKPSERLNINERNEDRIPAAAQHC